MSARTGYIILALSIIISISLFTILWVKGYVSSMHNAISLNNQLNGAKLNVALLNNNIESADMVNKSIENYDSIIHELQIARKNEMQALANYYNNRFVAINNTKVDTSFQDKFLCRLADLNTELSYQKNYNDMLIERIDSLSKEVEVLQIAQNKVNPINGIDDRISHIDSLQLAMNKINLLLTAIQARSTIDDRTKILTLQYPIGIKFSIGQSLDSLKIKLTSTSTLSNNYRSPFWQSTVFQEK